MYEKFNEQYYLNWLSQFFPNDNWYQKLINDLYYTEFTYFLAMDSNRAEDGINLRWKFAAENEWPIEIIEEYFRNRPCSVLEMMIALAIRCFTVFDESGDVRFIPQLISEMLSNMGLIDQVDDEYDPYETDLKVSVFLDRQYEKNGSGGLFIINNPELDLRSMDLWMQLNWYLMSKEQYN